MTGAKPPAPDAHALPHPGPEVDVHQRPFVGNETVEDNLCESAQIAVWNVLGHGGAGVSFEPRKDAVQVSGRVGSRADRDAALKAVAIAISPSHVIDDLTVDQKAGDVPVAPTPRGAPIVRVRRFCSLTDASLSAAVKSALDRLETVLAATGQAAPHQIAVIYRNRGASTVTIDVGVFSAGTEKSDALDVVTDAMPVGRDIALPAEPGVAGLMSAQAMLLRRTTANEHDAVFWQAFEDWQFRPWTGLPAAELHMVVPGA